MHFLKPWLDWYALHIAFMVAWVAMLGSLFFSEVLHFTPCLLCWYQRIAMYPLAIMLLIAVVKKDFGIYRYALPFSIIGGLISAYHYLLQKTDWVPVLTPCTLSVPCEASEINLLGFITIPLMSLLAFGIITFLMWYIRKQYEHRN